MSNRNKKPTSIKTRILNLLVSEGRRGRSVSIDRLEKLIGCPRNSVRARVSELRDYVDIHSITLSDGRAAYKVNRFCL